MSTISRIYYFDFSLQVGSYLQHLHERNGVKFYMNASVAELRGEKDQVKKAILRDGSELKVFFVFVNDITKQKKLRTTKKKINYECRLLLLGFTGLLGSQFTMIKTI